MTWRRYSLYIQHMTKDQANSRRSKAVAQTVNTVMAKCIGARALRLHRAVARLYDNELRPLGLRITQLSLLAAIEAEGRARPADLAEVLDMEKSTLSRNVKILVERGWVRVLDGEVGRTQVLELTKRGRSQLLQAMPAWEAAQKRVRAWLRSGKGKSLEPIVAVVLRD